MIFDQVNIRPWQRIIKKNHRARGECMYVIGGDTETIRGIPFTIQLYSQELGLAEIIEVEVETILPKLLDVLETLPLGTVTIYMHNLDFDMVSIFYNHQKLLAEEEFKIELKGWTIRGVFSDTKFAIFTKRDRIVYLVDTSAYFYGSLAKLAKIFCPDLPKLERPARLGAHRYSLKNKQFVDYAMRDAEIAYWIGKNIDKLHTEFGITQTFTLPHMASKIFRHHFLEHDIPLPPKRILYAALHSYHGGKNLITVEPGYYPNVTCLDIISAYPYAMTQLPSFSYSKLYRILKGRGTPSQVPELGIYRIVGRVKKCMYPCLFDHKFKPLSGEVNGVWVTGYELNEAIRAKEVEIKECYGYFYDREQDNRPSPFRAYVDYFFEKKKTENDPIKRLFFKIALNSLYGKFIQTNRSRIAVGYDLDSEEIFEEIILQAGGLFHPFIASLITGFTRAYIHRLEHEYNAIHTSTDGIMTQQAVDPSLANETRLGKYKIEAQGNLLLFRNKLYILYNDKGERVKYALHGFHGSVEVLEQMYKRGIQEYEYIKVNKLKESLRRGLVANDFVKVKAKLNVNLAKMKGG